SLTASRSLMIHAKFRGEMPAAHLPFTWAVPSRGHQPGRLHGGAHVVHAHHGHALVDGPDGGRQRAFQAVVDVGAAGEPADERLAAGPDEGGDPRVDERLEM